jgi:hypothetical protein
LGQHLLARRLVAGSRVDRGHPQGFRVLLTTGLVALYLAGSLAALALLARLWGSSL